MLFGKPLLGELLDYSDPLTKGLIAFWPENEGSGNEVLDLSGNGKGGTFAVDAPVWGAGKFGSALTFDGANNVVDYDDPAFFAALFTTTNYTANIWFKCSTSAETQIFFSSTGGGPSIFALRIDADGDAHVFIRDEDSLLLEINPSTGSSFLDNLWHMATVVRYGQTDTRLLIDAIQIGTSATSTATLALTALRLGQSAGDAIDGQLDIPSFYNRALILKEIQQLYRTPLRFVGKRRREGFVGAVRGTVNTAAQADIVTSSLAGFRRLNRPGAGQADIVTLSLAGMRWSMGAQADIVTSSLAGMRRLNRPGAAQAAINIQTFAGATGGAAVATLEEIFRYRRYRDAGVFRRRNLKGVY